MKPPNMVTAIVIGATLGAPIGAVCGYGVWWVWALLYVMDGK